MDGQRSNHGERRPCSESDSSEDSDDRDSLSMGPEDTVYRYLCPVKNVGCIIGRDGETIKQLMLETKSKIIISQLPGREERVVTIYSGSEKTNDFEGTGDNICPAQEALIKVHDRLVAVDTAADNSRIIARLLVPSDQIGCVVGKGGQLVQSTCGEIVAHVLKISSDDASSVKKALYQVASMLHDTPSPSQHLFSSCLPTIYPRNEASLKTFLLRLVCPVAMTGRVLGKRGSVINQIRQDSGASINVGYEGDDCLITISAKEAFEDTFSPVIDAALRLQPKCSERVKGQHGIDSFSTNLLVFSSQVGCLIGNEGSVLSEIRKVTNADIRILPKQSLPRIASRCETMVQLRGDLEIAKAALIQVTSRLRDNLFGKEDADSAYTPVVPYLNMSGGYGSAPTPPPVDAHGDYGGLELSTYVYPYPHTTGGYGSDPPPPPGDAYGDYGGLELSTYVYPHPHTSGGYGFQLQAGGGSDDSYESSSSGSSDDSRMVGQRSDRRKRPPRSESDDSQRGGNKRIKTGSDKDISSIGPDDTVYRYLCSANKIGHVIGRNGETIKQLRLETQSGIQTGKLPRSEERVVTIYSCSEKTNYWEGTGDNVCPAQEALSKVHDIIVAVDTAADNYLVTARLLVPSDQIGCVIGPGGHTVKNICSETGAKVRFKKDFRLSECASEEVLQISGEASAVKKALYQVASLLHEKQSKSQHLPSPSLPPACPSRNEASSRVFSLRLVFPAANYGFVLGKRGSALNQIRKESGASIRIENTSIEGDDCLLTITATEIFEDPFSPVIDAAMRLQPRCSERVKRKYGPDSLTTKLLVPSSRVGCLIGEGESIISEMRNLTYADILILPKDSLPRVASQADTMVQVSGILEVAKIALLQVAFRLRVNWFEKEPVLSYGSALPPVDADTGFEPYGGDPQVTSSVTGYASGLPPAPYGSSSSGSSVVSSYESLDLPYGSALPPVDADTGFGPYGGGPQVTSSVTGYASDLPPAPYGSSSSGSSVVSRC